METSWTEPAFITPMQGSLPAERPRQTHELALHVSSGVQTYLGPATSAAAVDDAGNLKISHVQSRVGERCCGATAYRERGERRASAEVEPAEQLADGSVRDHWKLVAVQRE